MREALSILFLSTATLAAGQGVSPQLLAKAAGAQNDSKPKVTINVPETISSDKIQIRYFLTGEFGGYGDYVRQQKKHHSYEIVAAVKDKPAGDIKIIAYSPGCAFKTYEFRFKEVPDPQAEFMCELLPHVTLQGHIVPKSILAGHKAVVVRIWYSASWDHEFFGIMDGMVQQFDLGEATLDSDGNFSVDLPDFSVDPMTQQAHQKGHGEAELHLYLVDATTLNPLADWLVFGEYGTLDGMLRIQPWYPKLTIQAVKRSVQTSPQ